MGWSGRALIGWLMAEKYTGPSRPSWGSIVPCILTPETRGPWPECLFLPLSPMVWLSPLVGVSHFLWEATWSSIGQREGVPLT